MQTTSTHISYVNTRLQAHIKLPLRLHCKLLCCKQQQAGKFATHCNHTIQTLYFFLGQRKMICLPLHVQHQKHSTKYRPKAEAENGKNKMAMVIWFSGAGPRLKISPARLFLSLVHIGSFSPRVRSFCFVRSFALHPPSRPPFFFFYFPYAREEMQPHLSFQSLS